MNGAMVVTGGGGGIGRAAALTHTRRGLPVVVWDAKLEAAESARDEMTALGRTRWPSGSTYCGRRSITDAARSTVDRLGRARVTQ